MKSKTHFMSIEKSWPFFLSLTFAHDLRTVFQFVFFKILRFSVEFFNFVCVFAFDVPAT